MVLLTSLQKKMAMNYTSNSDPFLLLVHSPAPLLPEQLC